MTRADATREVPPAVLTVRLTGALAVRLTIYGTALLYAALAIVLSIDRHATYHIDSLRQFGIIAVVGLFSAVATVAVHETVHGLFFRMCGGRPRYGVGLLGGFVLYAYATAPGMPFTSRQMTVICLAPLILLSTAALAALWFVPSMFGVAAVVFITNVSGSVGDLWITARIWRFRHCLDLVLVDGHDSMTFHTSDPHGAMIAARMTLAESGGVVRRFCLRAMAAILGMALAAMPLGIVLSMLGAPDVTIGPSRLPVVIIQPMGGLGLSIQMDGPGLILAGLAAAAASLPFRRRRQDARPEPPSAVPRPAFL